MEKYGVTLRNIRLEKNYTMKELANGVISVSFLSKFERGQSEISVHSFVKLLERLAVPFDEFFFKHYQFEENNFMAFFDKAYDAYLRRDLTEIKRLREIEDEKYQESQMDIFLCNTLMLDVYASIVSNKLIVSGDESLKKLYTYLFEVETWGYYELRLYNSTMLLMPTEMVVVLSETAYKKTSNYRGFAKLDTILLPILLNTLIHLTGGQQELTNKGEINTFFQYIHELGVPEHDLHTRNQLNALKGIYQIRKGNLIRGEEMVKKAINLLTSLDSNQLAKELKNYLDILLMQHVEKD